METKFTKDGRKVAVVGQLNKTEYIVQEIFVTDDGDEIPQGERFTASSLLDKPLLSYKAKEEQRVLKSLEELKATYDKKEKQLRDLEQRRKGAAEWMKQIDLSIKNLPNFDYDFFCDFVCGNFKYAIHVDYKGNPSKYSRRGFIHDDMVDVFLRFERNSWSGIDQFDMVRLLSVVGKSDGKLDYRINQYSDGSGSCNNEYVFFKTREEMESWVLEYIDKVYQEDELEEKHFDLMDEVGLEIPEHYVQNWYDKQIHHIRGSELSEIESVRERYKNRKESIEERLKRATNKSS
ncbi:MAG: hypothetical protein CL489_08895 [Acidobacteria bacterium]|nr:hypothetical protein [Acidobacteriota bacterium]|tara:strand:- start:44011 stop:44883 length:873 start_codon:yes stop_codon:yes gene_type:complete